MLKINVIINQSIKSESSFLTTNARKAFFDLDKPLPKFQFYNILT